MADVEREVLARTVIEQVAGRVPVIVTTTHFSSAICAERSKRAQDMGAAMVMVMPPYHGATIRVPESAIYEFYRTVSDAIEILIMIQDAPVSGTPQGPWDGEEGITLWSDLEAGATGAMTGGAYPDAIRPIVDAYAAGRRDEAFAAYQRWLPLLNCENRQAGLLAAKTLMKEGGVITCDAPRHQFPALHPAVRAGLLDTAKRLDPMVLRWGK